MKLLNLFSKQKRKVVLIVQCRLSSTRLPRKALLPLGGKTILEWVLASMKLVHADQYFLATDVDSADELKPFAKKCGYDFFAGSKEDVLDRFCQVIELSRADVVVRATADNPFLFYEAASSLLEEFLEREKTSPVDYITWTDLPHGSGIEIFNAHSLLKARNQTDNPYDHEHVGPALYNHQEIFSAVFLKAPNRWNFPELRTTVDTYADYRRALSLVHALSAKKIVEKPYTTEEIINGLWKPSVRFPLLLVPSTVKGRGTGHLRRCIDIALKTGADIYVPLDATLEQSAELVAEARQNGLEDYQIVRMLSGVDQYALVVTDLFNTDTQTAELLARSCPVAALDEGAEDTNYVDYLLDIIPSVGLDRKPNYTEPAFIPLPEKKRDTGTSFAAVHTAVVTLGGEDPAGLAIPACRALAQNNVYVTVIVQDVNEAKQLVPAELCKYIKIVPPVDSLREHLFEYDLVVTHYGFTAFEAATAGCAVILLGTTELHQRLAETYHFACIPSDVIDAEHFKELLGNPQKLYHPVSQNTQKPLAEFILTLSQGRRITCPVCRCLPEKKDIVVSRTPERTFRRCQKCGMLYQSWTIAAAETKYNHSYFYEDYQKQYGRTYLDDFASIKAQCVRRTSVIDFMYRRIHSPVTPTVLDIGCAMGPFLDAANDAGWQVFGTDISADAVEYVQKTLHYPAVCAPFPKFDAAKEFGIQKFDAVTMWYVIEHFENLDAVLTSVSKLIKKGGIFAFSTPSAAGISAKSNADTFFKNSPADHYTLWEPKRAAQILGKYGFKVVKIVSTGIHPERFPVVKQKGWKEKSLQYTMVQAAGHFFKLGDTFEVYCRKESDVIEQKTNGTEGERK